LTRISQSDCGATFFPEEFQVETVAYRGWKGLRNGALLAVAAGEFDVLVTMDDNLPEQQNLSEYDIAVVVLRARSKRMADLLELMPAVEQQLRNLASGEGARIFPPEG
jgi:hypothetical protein